MHPLKKKKQQCTYKCTIGTIIYREVLYLTVRAQSRQVKAKLFWSKEITPDGNSNSQELMKRTKSGK